MLHKSVLPTNQNSLKWKSSSWSLDCTIQYQVKNYVHDECHVLYFKLLFHLSMEHCNWPELNKLYILHQYWLTGNSPFFCSISRNFQSLIISAIKKPCSRLVIFLHLNRVNLITHRFSFFKYQTEHGSTYQLIGKPVM